ncbi:SDR family oxidoreductase [Burkholderia glumae]|uniref:SDR family oxidoreductase n=1 Tax=Burkholderia glumae TaxID=337 RepID=A0AAQ0BSS3_BURGL|nr:SDR family oxidoreductase [Burkholderia glumae]ACR31196.1 Short-chain dehydrogenase/reductase SDR [Burkholderia glumae BGR1]AJY63307.1 short chain dehydrogenase family protein [Burkholderia glumae LMG 2196 = ATCC 33617]KHJ64662.1 short-chain dehydrogenase [Burkholderia glumae]MCM2483465.1 SDR family oxidoreductase [Burkholderia glumae]MCM2511367.1 SDR family oxidoreductase [Burkholderia glumae]
MYEVLDQRGRRVVITGANSGTGREAARRLAAAGADLVMAVRSESKGDAARRDLQEQFPGASIEVRMMDLSSLASVREFATQLLEEGRPLDLLVNNAGVMMPPRRVLSSDGFELQFATNFLGHFALTNLLLPLLLEAKSPRVTTMTSSAAIGAKINFDDLQGERSYKPMAAYAQSKLACLLLANRLAEIAHERRWPLLSTSAHPGHARTNLQTSGPNLGTDSTRKRLLFKLVPSMSVEWATDSLLQAALEPTATQGAFYGPRFLLIGNSHIIEQPHSAKRADSIRLWHVAETLTQTRPPPV